MPRCLVSFGANIGNPAETIRAASTSLKTRLSGQNAEIEFQLSRFFKTPPVGGPTGQPPFVNAVAAIESKHSVWEHWAAVRAVEAEFGRERNLRWEARKLDLDILLYEDARIWTPQFKVPHPRMCMRRFILEPACDVAANWVDPVSLLSLSELAGHLRRQPVSITLLYGDSVPGMKIASSVAEISGAKICLDSDLGSVGRTAVRELRLRKVGCTDLVEMAHHDIATCEGIVVYLPPSVGERLGAWEDIHRDAAVAMNLLSAGDENAKSWRGPRYLLASDDEPWAIHELNAAYEAMDCPVEPIADDV
ncbi:MAG: 2-amino-4-hydroxy-6-hydroxymethyldihydropteridine diphosphokinase [Aureliella sp.]